MTGLARAMEAIAPFLRMKPEMMEAFDVDAIADLALEAHGVPHRVLKSPVERRKAAKAAAAEATPVPDAPEMPAGASPPPAMDQVAQQIRSAMQGGVVQGGVGQGGVGQGGANDLAHPA